MKKQKILLLIPLTIIAGFLIYTFIVFIVTDNIGTWRHYLALGLFLLLIFLFFKNFKVATFATGVYLLLGICNLLTLTPEINTSWFVIFSLDTPHINSLSFGLFCLYLLLNLDSLANFYYDFKEENENKSKLD